MKHASGRRSFVKLVLVLGIVLAASGQIMAALRRDVHRTAIRPLLSSSGVMYRTPTTRLSVPSNIQIHQAPSYQTPPWTFTRR